jgi:hypothetical protein
MSGFGDEEDNEVMSKISGFSPERLLEIREEEGEPMTRERLMEALQSLERDGYVHSELCPDGKLRWFITGKQMPDDEDGS